MPVDRAASRRGITWMTAFLCLLFTALVVQVGVRLALGDLAYALTHLRVPG